MAFSTLLLSSILGTPADMCDDIIPLGKLGNIPGAAVNLLSSCDGFLAEFNYPSYSFTILGAKN